MKQWMAAAVALLLIVIAIAASQLGGITVQAAAAQRGSIREYVDEQGKTRLPKVHLITMPFAGRIEAIELTAGEQVQADQEVARVAPQDLADAVAEAEAVVERVRASIAESRDVTVEESAEQQATLFTNSMESTVAAARQRMLAAAARLDYAKTDYGRVESLFRNGAQTQQELDRAKLSFDERQHDYSQDALVLAALQAMQKATDLLPRIISQYTERKSLNTAVLQQQLLGAEARLSQAKLRQRRGSMKSPVSGVVLERLVLNERFVEGGTVLLRIGRLQEMEVEVEVLSEDVVNVHVGNAVEIYGAAIGAEVGGGVVGTVTRVHPAGFTKVSSLGVEQQRVLVIVGFDAPVVEELHTERGVGVDYRVRVRIFTEESQNAVTIPRSALFRGPDGGWQVFAVRGGKAELTSVEVGLMNDERVEIVSGVEEAENVVLAPESNLEDGSRVELVVSSSAGFQAE